MRIIIAGGSGFVGSAVVELLINNNHNVVILSRNPGPFPSFGHNLIEIRQWTGSADGSPVVDIDGADAIINLSGENIASKRWTAKQKMLLRRSRIDPTRALIDAIAHAEKKPNVLINASAVGYYGSSGPGDVVETDPKGSGYLADLCEEWEREAVAAEKFSVRVVLLRIGVVLASSGGALKKIMLPFRMYAGGPIGSGNQWFPWIHRDDLANVIYFALERNTMEGAVNAVSPSPITMNEFVKSLGGAMKKPSWLPVPSFLLKIALGEMSEMLTDGRRIIPRKLMDNNFVFRYPKIGDSLQSIIGKKN